MSEKPSKPGTIADAEALGRAPMRRRRGCARGGGSLPRVLCRPAEVFAALRERRRDRRGGPLRADPRDRHPRRDGGDPADARPGGRCSTTESLDWLVLAVVTFIGGLFYGTAGYFLLGLVVWLGARGVGLDTRARPARQLVAFSALPFALSLFVTVPAIVFGFGYDWFRTGGSDDGAGRVVVLSVGLAFALWSLGLLSARPADDLRAAVARRRSGALRSRR